MILHQGVSTTLTNIVMKLKDSEGKSLVSGIEPTKFTVT
jgi:hypothetical protein